MFTALVIGHSFVANWRYYLFRKITDSHGIVSKSPAKYMKLENTTVDIRGYSGLRLAQLDDPSHHASVKLDGYLKSGDAQILVVDALINDLDSHATVQQTCELARSLSLKWLKEGAIFVFFFLI